MAGLLGEAAGIAHPTRVHGLVGRKRYEDTLGCLIAPAITRSV